jgi:hypothetical protein
MNYSTTVQGAAKKINFFRRSDEKKTFDPLFFPTKNFSDRRDYFHECSREFLFPPKSFFFTTRTKLRDSAFQQAILLGVSNVKLR